ncbi:hypothetical protein [Lysinibacillus pakistanensis]
MKGIIDKSNGIEVKVVEVKVGKCEIVTIEHVAEPDLEGKWRTIADS